MFKIVFFPFEYTNALHGDTHLLSTHLMGQWARHPLDLTPPLTPPFNDGPSVTVPAGRVTGLFAGPAGCSWLIGQQIVRGDGHVTVHISIWVKNQANVANSMCMRERWARVSQIRGKRRLKCIFIIKTKHRSWCRINSSTMKTFIFTSTSLGRTVEERTRGTTAEPSSPFTLALCTLLMYFFFFFFF